MTIPEQVFDDAQVHETSLREMTDQQLERETNLLESLVNMQRSKLAEVRAAVTRAKANGPLPDALMTNELNQVATTATAEMLLVTARSERIRRDEARQATDVRQAELERAQRLHEQRHAAWERYQLDAGVIDGQPQADILQFDQAWQQHLVMLAIQESTAGDAPR